jgi:DNA-binding transcriptional ArsR family regulator
MSNSLGLDTPRGESLEAGDPCRVWIRPSWPLIALELLVVSDVAPAQLRTLADQVPGWRTVRALILHGVALRDAVAMGPDAVDAVRTPSRLRRWIEDQGPTWWESLLAEAAGQGLAYRRQQDARRTGDAVEESLGPGCDGRHDRAAWRELVLRQALAWGVDEAMVSPFVDPVDGASRCLDVIEAALACVADDATRAADGMEVRQLQAPTAAHALEHLTGRPIRGPLAAEMGSVRELIIVPTPGLVQEWPVARRQHRWTVWAEMRRDAAAQQVDPTALLVALGDPLNVRIVEAVARAPGYALQLAAQLSSHASTLSRHLNQLAEAGWLLPDPRGHRVVYRLNPAAAEALERWTAMLGGHDQSP